MKKIFTILFMGSCLISQAQTWYNQTSNTNQKLNSIVILTTNTSYAAGNTGTVLKTTDGGIQWNSVSPTSIDFFYDILPFSVNDLWISGTNGVLFHTTDGGANWSSSTSGTSANLYGMFASTTSTIFVTGDNGTILKTIDGGANWSTLNSGITDGLKDIVSTGSQKLVAVGNSGSVIVSTDNGDNWNTITSNTSSTLGDIKSFSGITLAAGTSGAIIKSTDGGDSWTLLNTGTSEHIKCVAIVSSSEYYAVGYSGTILHSTDGGANWNSMISPTTEDLFSLSRFPATNEMHACGDNGKIIRYGSTNEIFESTEKNEMIVFPNPSSAQITIQTNGTSAIEIFNTIGELILQISVNNELNLDLSNWREGIYFIKNLTTGKTEKLIID